MSIFGNTASSTTNNPFAVKTTSSSSMSTFENSTYNPFAVYTSGNSPVPVWGNTNTSTSNPFAVSTIGNTPDSVLRNPFAVTTASRAPESTFGNTNNPSHNLFGNTAMSSYGNTNNSTHNPFGNTTWSSSGNTNNLTHNPFGNTTWSSSGNMNSSTHNPFGNTGMPSSGNTNNSTHNPFGNTTWTSSGNTNSSTHSPFGNTAMSSSGNMNNSTPNIFGVNTIGNATSPSLPTQRLSFNGTSTGVFGAQSSSFRTPPNFGLAAAATGNSGSPTVPGFGPFRIAPGPVSLSTGSHFGTSSNTIFGPINPSASSPGSFMSTLGGTNTFDSNTGSFNFGSTTAPLQSTLSPGPNSSFSFGVTQAPIGQAKGSNVRSYAPTKDPGSNDRFVSISSMPDYASKSHEELRWEDYELKLGGVHNSAHGSSGVKDPPAISSSMNSPWNSPNPVSPFRLSFPPQIPASTPSVPANNTWSNLQNSFLQSTAPSLYSTPSNSTTSLSPLHSFSFPSISTGNNASSSFLNPFSQTSAPSSNLTPNYFSTNLGASSTTIPSSTTNTVVAPSLFRTNPGPVSTPIPSSTNTLPPAPASSLNVTLSTNPMLSSTQPCMRSHTLDNQVPITSWTGLNGVGQPSPSQQFASTDKVADCIIAVKDPFGSQLATSQSSIGHLTYSPVIQHGISSMPVIEKPASATTRVSALVSTRHVSVRPLTVHARKYNPKKDMPKVPFFDHLDETQDIRKEFASIIPRTNPRSVFGSASKVSEVSCAKEEVSLRTDASPAPHEDGNSFSLSIIFQSTPAIYHVEAKQRNSKLAVPRRALLTVDLSKFSGGENCIQVKPSLPQLQRSDYYTEPSVQELISAENSNPGFCSHVKDFVVGRHGYGWVKFERETDVHGLDLDALVHFNKMEVVVYVDDNEKPALGEGLNKPAEVTLLNVKCTDKTGKQYSSGKMVAKFMDKLKEVAQEQGAEFVSYDAANAVWKFRVKHFSRYGATPEDLE